MYMIERPNAPASWYTRKPREPRLTKNDYRPYKSNLSYSWKDQSKRRHQYRTVEM